jgi:putative resolvase
MIKLSQWSKKQGITYNTAWRWVKSGKMPLSVKVHIMPSGTILIEEI